MGSFFSSASGKLGLYHTRVRKSTLFAKLIEVFSIRCSRFSRRFPIRPTVRGGSAERKDAVQRPDRCGAYYPERLPVFRTEGPRKHK